MGKDSLVTFLLNPVEMMIESGEKSRSVETLVRPTQRAAGEFNAGGKIHIVPEI
jgi:hypothetical protein